MISTFASMFSPPFRIFLIAFASILRAHALDVSIPDLWINVSAAKVVSRDEAEFLTDAIRKAATRVDVWRVLPREVVRQKMDSLYGGGVCEGPRQDSCAIDVGNALLTAYHVNGSISVRSSKLVVSVHLYDVWAGEKIGTKQIQAESVELFSSQLEVLAQSLFVAAGDWSILASRQSGKKNPNALLFGQGRDGRGQGSKTGTIANASRLHLRTVDVANGFSVGMSAAIEVNGVASGNTPLDLFLPAGEYEFKATAPGFTEQRFRVKLDAGVARDVDLQFWSREPTKKDNRMVAIPSGCFESWIATDFGKVSGVRRACLSDFWMDRTEVTRTAYNRIMFDSYGPRFDERFGPGFGVRADTSDCASCPAVVGYEQAKKYCSEIGKRLPTDAEWEYAARAGTTTEYYWGDDESRVGEFEWHSGWQSGNRRVPSNNQGKYQPVGQKKPNDWGLFDVVANSCEWVSDDSPYFFEREQWNPHLIKFRTARGIRRGCPQFPAIWVRWIGENSHAGFRCAASGH